GCKRLPWVFKVPPNTCTHHRNLRKRCLLRFAHRDAADAEKSALLGGLGNVLADLAQPALESRCIAGRLGIDHRASLPRRLDAWILRSNCRPTSRNTSPRSSGACARLRNRICSKLTTF